MSNIKVVSQYIKDFSFNLPSAPQIFLNPQHKPDIALSIDIDAKKIGEENFEVSLKIAADATIEDDKLFNCKITYGGLFVLQNIFCNNIFDTGLLDNIPIETKMEIA